MLLNEFIKEAEKNQMIAAILKDHKVRVRVVHKSIKDYAYYVLGKGVLERSEEHTSELQSRRNLVCRLLLEKKNKSTRNIVHSP